MPRFEQAWGGSLHSTPLCQRSGVEGVCTRTVITMGSLIVIISATILTLSEMARREVGPGAYTKRKEGLQLSPQAPHTITANGLLRPTQAQRTLRLR
jgi:hypothetical protein